MSTDMGALAGELGAGDVVVPATDSIARKQSSMLGVRETLKIIIRARPENP